MKVCDKFDNIRPVRNRLNFIESVEQIPSSEFNIYKKATKK